MTRSEIIKKLVKNNPQMDLKTAESFVNLFFKEITMMLNQGGRVELRGFGVFSSRDRQERMGRNPRTGEPVHVQAKTVPFFKAGKELRQKLNV